MSTDRHDMPPAGASQQAIATPGPDPASGQAASPASTGSGKADAPPHVRQPALPVGKPPGAAAGADRLAREAAALRANLHRRKQQARQRQQVPTKDRSEPQS